MKREWAHSLASIHYFHIDHNALCLPPPQKKKTQPPFFCNRCIRSLLGRLWYPGEIGNNSYAKFCGVNKVHYFMWKWHIQWIAQLVSLILIHREAIYPVDSAIHRFNNRCQTRPQSSLFSLDRTLMAEREKRERWWEGGKPVPSLLSFLFPITPRASRNCKNSYLYVFIRKEQKATYWVWITNKVDQFENNNRLS